MIPVVTCPSCELRQWQLEPSVGPNSKSAVCRRCRAPLGFSVVEIPLDPINPQSQNRPNDSLGSVILSLRRSRHRTQLSLALQAGTGRSHIARIESNTVMPNLSTCLSILRALGVSNIYLKLSEPDQASKNRYAQKNLSPHSMANP